MRALPPERTTPSATVSLNDTVARLRADGRVIRSLSSGDPDFATPEHIVEAGVAAMRAGRTHYAPSRGIAELTTAIAAARESRTGVIVDAATDVVVMPSAKYALATAIEATVGFGEKVMILSPSWVSYASMVTIAGAEPYFVALSADKGFRLDADTLEAGWVDGTRMIIINSPNNPTGHIFDTAELDALAAFVLRHDLLVLSDEIYEDIAFDEPAVSIVTRQGLAERTIVVSGFSKAYAMTGWRLGYTVAPAHLTARILSIHQHVASCTATFVQDAGVAALEGGTARIDAMVAEYAERIDASIAALTAIPGVTVTRPDGAFYLFADVSGTAHPESLDFSAWVLEGAGVSVVPGASFGPGAEHHVRIAMTAPTATLLEAIAHLREFITASTDESIQQ